MIEPYNKTTFDDLIQNNGPYNRFYLHDEEEVGDSSSSVVDEE